jgi:hypothetical protein
VFLTSMLLKDNATHEIDCNQTTIGFPSVTSAILFVAQSWASRRIIRDASTTRLGTKCEKSLYNNISVIRWKSGVSQKSL